MAASLGCAADGFSPPPVKGSSSRWVPANDTVIMVCFKVQKWSLGRKWEQEKAFSGGTSMQLQIGLGISKLGEHKPSGPIIP